jgi:Tol biopolymer transport system component
MGRRVLAVAVIAFAIAAVLFPSAATAAFPGKNGRIAYVGAPAGGFQFDIFTVRPKGSGLRQLTDDPIEEFDPSWSADGRRLVFTRFEPAGSTVFTINADGGDPTRVVDDAGEPSFSPSGRRIVYTTGDSIRTVRPDGTKPRRLLGAHPRGGLGSPQYSPSGRRIVFDGRPRRKPEQGIWTMRRDGSRLRQLIVHRPPSLERKTPIEKTPDYSPDGRHIVICHGCATGDGVIRRMRADGSNRRRVLRADDEAAGPAYAPDGERIAVSIGTVGVAPGGLTLQSCSDLYTVSPTASDRERLTHWCGSDGVGGHVFSPSWQPLRRFR